MTDRDSLWCAVNLLLDDEQELEQLCPTCRSRAQEERCLCCGAPICAGEGVVNSAFDEARFQTLKRGDGHD